MVNAPEVIQQQQNGRVEFFNPDTASEILYNSLQHKAYDVNQIRVANKKENKLIGEKLAHYEEMYSKYKNMKENYHCLEGATQNATRRFSKLAGLKVFEDTCEVKISGVPPTLELTPETIVERIFGVLDIPNLVNQVIDARQLREWKSNKNKKNSERSSITITLSSPNVRDLVVSKTPNLRGKSARLIFGMGGSRKVYMAAVWPKPVDKLLMEAKKISKLLGYAEPEVRNLVVFLRKSAESEDVIPVWSKSDLKEYSDQIVGYRISF